MLQQICLPVFNPLIYSECLLGKWIISLLQVYWELCQISSISCVICQSVILLYRLADQACSSISQVTIVTFTHIYQFFGILSSSDISSIQNFWTPRVLLFTSLTSSEIKYLTQLSSLKWFTVRIERVNVFSVWRISQVWSTSSFIPSKKMWEELLCGGVYKMSTHVFYFIQAFLFVV